MGNIKSFCCKDSASDIDDREERSRILNDNCGNSTDNLYNNSTTSALSQHDNISYGSMNHGNNSKSIEQSALDRIYQKMAANVIDVAPGESMVIQPAEFVERQKAYQAKLNQIKTPLPLKTSRVPKHMNSTLDARLNSSSPSLANANNINLISSNNISTNTSTISNNFNINSLSPGNATTNCSRNNNSPQNVGKEKRRVEYEPISMDDMQLINEISIKSVQAIRALKINSQEEVVTQFKP